VVCRESAEESEVAQRSLGGVGILKAENLKSESAADRLKRGQRQMYPGTPITVKAFLHISYGATLRLLIAPRLNDHSN
jgi:hypothetical protein